MDDFQAQLFENGLDQIDKQVHFEKELFSKSYFLGINKIIT